MRLASITLLLFLFLGGCLLNTTPKLEGGDGTVTRTKEIDTTKIDGSTEKIITSTSVKVRQPQDSKTPAVIKFDDDENVTITTGASQSVSAIASVAAKFNMLDKLMIAGIGFIVGGALAFIFLKSFTFAMPLFVIGGSLIAASYFLAAYGGIIFGICCGVAVLYVVYLFYSHRKVTQDNQIQKTANIENVSLIEAMKHKLSPEHIQEVFKGTPDKAPLVNTIQSDTTKQVVKDIKYKENL
jgi:hypothetical protein